MKICVGKSRKHNAIISFLKKSKVKKYVLFIFFTFLCYTLNAQNEDGQNDLIVSITTTPTCSNTAEGTATITISGGVSPYTFMVDEITSVIQLDNSYMFTDLIYGTYHVSVEDANGSHKDESFTVNSYPVFTATAEQTKFVRCEDPIGGSVTIQVGTEDGNSKDFRYKLNEDDEWQELPEMGGVSGLLENTYTIIVADGYGCEVLIKDLAVRKAKTEIEATGKNLRCFGDNMGSIIATAAVENDIDGTPGSVEYYQLYNYSDWVKSGYFNDLSAGSYTVRAKDSYGCVNEASTTVVEPERSLGLTLIEAKPPYGNVKGSITVRPRGGWEVYTISCFEIKPNAQVELEQKFVGVPAGDYTFVNLEGFEYLFLISDKEGCPAFFLSPTMEPPTSEIDLELSDLKIFPNPTGDGLFFIEWNSVECHKVTLEVFNMSGRLVYKTDTQTGARTTLDISNQSCGAYLLRIPEMNITQKIVIE